MRLVFSLQNYPAYYGRSSDFMSPVTWRWLPDGFSPVLHSRVNSGHPQLFPRQVNSPERGTSKKSIMKDIKFFSLFNSFRDSVVTKPVVSLGNLFELPVLGKRLGWRLLSACFPSATKFTGRLRQLTNFIHKLLRMHHNHGQKYVVKYLKANQLAISKAIAGNPFRSLRELEPDLPLPRLSSSGLPPVIPLMDRRAIMSGSPSVIR